MKIAAVVIGSPCISNAIYELPTIEARDCPFQHHSYAATFHHDSESSEAFIDTFSRYSRSPKSRPICFLSEEEYLSDKFKLKCHMLVPSMFSDHYSQINTTIPVNKLEYIDLADLGFYSYNNVKDASEAPSFVPGTHIHSIVYGSLKTYEKSFITASARHICQAQGIYHFHTIEASSESLDFLAKLKTVAPCIIVKPYSINNVYRAYDFKLLSDQYSNSKYWSTHLKDYVRLDILYKYGGVYSDTDVYWVNPVGVEDKPSFSVFADFKPSNGIITSPAGHLGLALIMDSFIDNYNSNDLFQNGPDAVSDVANSRPDLFNFYEHNLFFAHFSSPDFVNKAALTDGNKYFIDSLPSARAYHYSNDYTLKKYFSGSDWCNILTKETAYATRATGFSTACY